MKEKTKKILKNVADVVMLVGAGVSAVSLFLFCAFLYKVPEVLPVLATVPLLLTSGITGLLIAGDQDAEVPQDAKSDSFGKLSTEVERLSAKRGSKKCGGHLKRNLTQSSIEKLDQMDATINKLDM